MAQFFLQRASGRIPYASLNAKTSPQKSQTTEYQPRNTSSTSFTASRMECRTLPELVCIAVRILWSINRARVSVSPSV